MNADDLYQNVHYFDLRFGEASGMMTGSGCRKADTKKAVVLLLMPTKQRLFPCSTVENNSPLAYRSRYPSVRRRASANSSSVNP